MKFVCYINIHSNENEENKIAVDESNYSEEYRRKLIDNNFDMMKGATIQVTTDKSLIPKHFEILDNYNEMKEAVTQDMEGNNLSMLL